MTDVEAVGEASPAWQPKTESNEGSASSDADTAAAPKLLLVTIATKLVASPLAAQVSVVLCTALCVLTLTEIDEASTGLSVLFRVCMSAIFLPLSLPLSLPLYSLHGVTRRDEGQQKSLSVSSMKISTKAANGIKRWHGLLLVMSVLFVLVGLNAFLRCGVFGKPHPTSSSRARPRSPFVSGCAARWPASPLRTSRRSLPVSGG